MRVLIASALTLLLLVVGTHSAEAAGSKRLAVLYFENQGNPELEMLKLGLAQMLITDLAPRPELEVIERTRLNEILGELDLQKTGALDSDSAVRIGKVLSVEFLVQGYYLYFKPVDSLIIGATVVSVETGAVVGSFRTQGKQSDFLDLEAQLVAGLMPTLIGSEPATRDDEPKGGSKNGTKSGPKKKTAAVRGGPRPHEVEGIEESAEDDRAEVAQQAEKLGEGAVVDSLGAALAFSEGLDALDHRDIPRAREALRRAVDLDPTLDDARLALAEIKL